MKKTKEIIKERKENIEHHKNNPTISNSVDYKLHPHLSQIITPRKIEEIKHNKENTTKIIKKSKLCKETQIHFDLENLHKTFLKFNINTCSPSNFEQYEKTESAINQIKDIIKLLRKEYSPDNCKILTVISILGSNFNILFKIQSKIEKLY